jgi:hypothetical protein
MLVSIQMVSNLEELFQVAATTLIATEMTVVRVAPIREKSPMNAILTIAPNMPIPG